MASENELKYDIESDIRAFDDSKAGVKGLVDAGVTNIPKFFRQKDNVDANNKNSSSSEGYEIPLIDLEGIDDKDGIRRDKVILQVKNACEKYGFFQIINHGIPVQVMDQMLDAIKAFHEQEVDVKKEYYCRDPESKKLKFWYHSNYNLLDAKVAAWRDTANFIRGTSHPIPHDLPPICRDIMIHYTNEMMKLGETIYGLLSEALGLDRDYLKNIGCNDDLFAPCHYYPPCPQPELTIGTAVHADSGFITVLLQSNMSGLQVLHQDHWIDVVPKPGVLVVNIGLIMQLITNNKFVSALHRVLASKEGPRISMACFFRAHHSPEDIARLYKPIEELLSLQNPPLYRAVTVKEVVSNRPSLNLAAFAIHNNN